MTQSMRRFYSFILRIWVEEPGTDSQTDPQAMRAMVRNLESGETGYFHRWQDLAAFVDAQLVPSERSAPPPDEQI